MQVNKDRLVKTLQSLVRIPSFQDSLKVSKWVKDEMGGIGFNVISDNDGNLIAEIGKGPGFILNAHLDTVGAGDGWKHGPFSGTIENGRLYGRGSSDCKAGVASMIEIARVLKKESIKKRVVFTFTAFEEGYPLVKNGVYRILPKLKNIDKGLVLEPTYSNGALGIYVGCRGSARYQIDIIGERGHSSTPERYDNPIYKFPKLLEELRSFPKGTMNVGILGKEISDAMTVTEIWAKEGGNVIPAKCTITIDRRSLPTEKPGEPDKKIRALCEKALGKKFAMENKSSVQGYLYEDPEFLEMCKQAVISAGCKTGADFLMARIDASILYNFAGIGALKLGPGTKEQAHVIDEYCDLQGLQKATEAVLGVIRRWDGS